MKRLFFVLLILCSQVNALDLNQAYRDGTATGTSHTNQSIDVLKALDLNQFPGYQANLPQEQYYAGVAQKSTKLEADSQKAVDQDDAAKSISERFNHRPKDQVNPSSDSMQKLDQIAENGDAIMHDQNPNAFCLDGGCAKHEARPANEDDFKKAMSMLSATSDASKNFDGQNNFIFKGEMLECSKVFTGFKNCCRDSGWGVDLNLAHCSDAEKKLGKARENKLVVPTGEYCFKRKKLPIGSVCVDHHETYCVFQSKLARIVQEQGRLRQLHIGFGQGKYSNCSGITPKQMQSIHFEHIDFSEFYTDVQNKLKKPDDQQTTESISQHLKEFYSQGDING